MRYNELCEFFRDGIIVVVIFIIIGIVGYADTHYTLNATVVEIENNNVIVEDNNNRTWAFEGSDFTIGQNLTLRMCTNGTDNIIIDDEVVGVKTIGH